MAKDYILLTQTDEEAVCEAFYLWIADQRSQIIGISENHGCGCCVDLYYLRAEDELTVPEDYLSGGIIETEKMHFGDKKEEILDSITGLP